MNDEIVHDFNKDNVESSIVENDIIEYIKNEKYPSTYKYTPNNGDYDIFIDEINDGIEVKFDKESINTGNFCIEYGQDGRDSGILVTKAKYWIQTDKINIHLAKTERILNMLNWYINTENKFINIILNSDLTGNDLENLIKKLRTELTKFGIRLLLKYPEKQLNGTTKLMDLMIVPKSVFNKICLEVAPYNEMTYNKLL
jgi:hypothetical protein